MTQKTVIRLLTTVLTLACMTSSRAQPAATPGAEETKLIGVLTSDAARKAKADACLGLSHIGTAKAVPALAALLSDQKLSHMARYALEPIRDPAVDVALREALGKLKGRVRLGIIGSIGVRRDRAAVAPLGNLLSSGDADTTDAAARALGKIGTTEAAHALETALADVPSPNRAAVHDGLLSCAEALLAGGKVARSQSLYDRLRNAPGASPQVRSAALRGAALVRGKDGVPLLIEALSGNVPSLAQAAARTALEMQDAAVTRSLADALPGLPADRQMLVLSVLGKHGDESVLPVLTKLAETAKGEIRVAAIRTVPEIGDASAAKALIGLRTSPEKAVSEAALAALSSLSGPDVDNAIMAMLQDEDAGTRRTAIDLIGQRHMLNAIPALLKTVSDSNKDVRAAGIRTLGKLAGPGEFPVLVKLLAASTASAEIRALEGALSGICAREARPSGDSVTILKAVYGDLPDGVSADVTKEDAKIVASGNLSIAATNGNFGDPIRGTRKKMRVEYIADGVTRNKIVNENETLTIMAGAVPLPLTEALIGAMPSATPAAKSAILRVLKAARGPEALSAVRQAASTADKTVRDEAIAVLCGWATVAALPDVSRLAKSSKDKRAKILALRGCFRLIPAQDVSSSKKVAALQAALALAERPEEKRLALSALAAIPTRASLETTSGYLDDPALRQEAGLAVLAIAEKVAASCPTEIAAVLPKLQALKAGKDIGKRIAALSKRVGEELNPSGFESIFDGKTLTGWEGKPGFWSVQDGAITGQTTKETPTKGNTFLIWRGGTLKDFELRIRFRIASHNSGIQYRSADLGDFVVGGYQADIDASSHYAGIIYEERGRGIIGPRTRKTVIGADGKRESTGKTCDEKELLASLKKGTWNEYVITARGNQIVQKINGYTTVELTDNQKEKRLLEGILALQLHAGPPMLVQFKDVRLKRLN